MIEITSDFRNSLDQITQRLREELKGIRTGRANTGMVEGMPVEAYGGTKMRLIELSSITVDGANALLITPFDPSTIKDIEKAILTSPLGMNPQTEGNRITIRIPPLTEEQRIKYAKMISQLVEDTKNKVRFERDSVRKKIKNMEDAKELTEDERFRLEKEIDEISGKKNEELQELKTSKEKEIMEF
ncbi:MAG: ribosome recycling factor [Candidatus Levybacteria bacterium CG10_big_fil_rev_8_21_14_0_10_36_7]|nr:MAG: ribosome recycling factor [Candidatus Levybacteria bacterium CG10_big_fil_rev_8_21_14_0_10_36_7]